jgi:anti-sigma factor RsiW
MTRDELEFQISQYLDGTLAGDDQSALEARLADDADARALLDEYRRLDVVLKAAPVPAVDWDALSTQICGAVAEQADEPAQSYRIGVFRTMAGLALAACLLIGLGFGIRLMQPPRTNQTGGGGGVAVNPSKAPVEIVVVDATPASTAPAASAEPIVGIAVGPATSLQDRPGFAGFHDELISRPSQVFIARGGEPVHDATFLP